MPKMLYVDRINRQDIDITALNQTRRTVVRTLVVEVEQNCIKNHDPQRILMGPQHKRNNSNNNSDH